jgi:uncharacterized protein (DUF169 family)
MSSDEKKRKGMTRRDFFKGAAVAGAAVAGAGSLAKFTEAKNHGPWHPPKWNGPEWGYANLSLPYLNQAGEDLESKLILRSSPIGIKMLRNESEAPTGARRPGQEEPGDVIGGRLSLCQAFGLARRGNPGLTIAMFATDHRCFEPVIAFGLKPPVWPGAPDYMSGGHAPTSPRLPYREGSGMVFGPLKAIDFKPDLVMIYCNPGQLRHLLLVLGMNEPYYEVNSTFWAIGSCGRSAVPPLLSGEASIAVPDPGEYERAGTTEDMMILTLPAKERPVGKGERRNLFEMLMESIKGPWDYKSFHLEVRSDHPQPKFYKDYFNAWGLGD